MRHLGLLLPLALLATPAHADPLTGNWRVAGNVSGNAFVVNCSFSGNGGKCVETGEGKGKAGKVHPLTHATLASGQASWTYPVSAMLMTFDMTFTGALTGDRITGTATAAGRKGQFTATRLSG
jgi:hypothetical protein